MSSSEDQGYVNLLSVQLPLSKPYSHAARCAAQLASRVCRKVGNRAAERQCIRIHSRLFKIGEAVDTPQSRRNALGRLVARENNASDLLAFLFEMDPRPIVGLLGLEDGPYTCQREVQAQGAGKGRLDLVVRQQADGQPIAVLEMKGASDLHGDQLDRYNLWAESINPAPKQFYCTLDGDGATPPVPWRPLSLVKLFGAWRTSNDANAAWLAGETADVLRTWDQEADGIIGQATGWYVPDLVSRRTAAAIDARLARALQDGSEARAYRTKGGNPMFVAWRRHPRGSDKAWIALDVRCEGRGDPSRAWLVRPCVDITSSGKVGLLEAHDLAVGLQPAMILPAIQDALMGRGLGKLAGALQAASHGGLSGPADAAVLGEWRARIANGARPSRLHPVFFHDRGLRLATQFRLDVGQLTRHDLADLTMAILDHLLEHA